MGLSTIRASVVDLTVAGEMAERFSFTTVRDAIPARGIGAWTRGRYRRQYRHAADRCSTGGVSRLIGAWLAAVAPLRRTSRLAVLEPGLEYAEVTSPIAAARRFADPSGRGST
jgi:hypothetical protein